MEEVEEQSSELIAIVILVRNNQDVSKIQLIGKSHLRFANLNNPKIDFGLDGVLPLESVYGLFNHPAITDGRFDSCGIASI